MKRIISILIALALCLFACAKQDDAGTDGGATNGSGDVANNGGQSDPSGDSAIDDDSDIAKLISAVVNTLSQDNATLTIDLSQDSEASVAIVDVKADLKNGAFVYAYTESYGGQDSDFTYGYDDSTAYECEQPEIGLPRGRVTKLAEENSPTGLGALISILENPSQLNAQNLVNTVSGIVFGSGTENTAAEHIVAYAVSSLADEEWLTDLAGFSVSNDGASEVYTISPDIYGIAKELLSYMEGKIDAELLSDAVQGLEDDKEDMNAFDISVVITVTDGLLDSAQLGYDAYLTSGSDTTVSEARAAATPEKGGIFKNSIRLTFSDYGNTVVPIDELKNTLDQVHNGHTNCVKCGDEVYFSCYCYSCAYEIYCENLCGNLRPEDNSYCSDCYIPCAGCGQVHGYKDGYCYECYYKVYCSEDCGNNAVHFPETSWNGYCDDCYSPCPDCGSQGNENCNGYCYSCFSDKYCSSCRVNTITHQLEYEGYCDDCYAPCPDCGEQGNGRYDGYCYDCFSDKYCMMCDEKEITHPDEYGGYCDDCFKACTVCGEYASSSVEGYCYDCARTVYCRNCHENKITHTTADGAGYCDECYTKCSECGIEMREIINGQCYECYYNKYCHECGENEITHGTGAEHKLCDECYQ